MADEPINLVLEHLRQMRAQIAALEDKMDRGFTSLSQRLDTLQTEVRGVNYVATVSIGAVLSELSDLKARVARLESR